MVRGALLINTNLFLGYEGIMTKSVEVISNRLKKMV